MFQVLNLMDYYDCGVKVSDWAVKAVKAMVQVGQVASLTEMICFRKHICWMLKNW